MVQLARPTKREDFEIAIICALGVERNAVEALLDELYETDGVSYGKAAGDDNAYSTGRVGSHHVVLAHMPGMGKVISAAVASGIRFSFTGIKLAILVGVCGGVPKATGGQEILLGDVIISNSVVQIDFGRQYPNAFHRKDNTDDNLGRANPEIRAFLRQVSGDLASQNLKDKVATYLTNLCEENSLFREAYPGAENDRLFPPSYRHKHQDSGSCTTCSECRNSNDEVCEKALNSPCVEVGCDSRLLIRRERVQIASGLSSDGRKINDKAQVREAQKPSIHFGRIASGDGVMKSGERRDEIAAREKVIGFEMEGAGAWERLPTLVIKSVCDYADSHKSKDWQRYAAATAACCMKAILGEWRSEEKSLSGPSHLDSGTYNIPFSLRGVPAHNKFVDRPEDMAELERVLLGQAGRRQVFVLRGVGGIGKTQLAVEFTRKHHDGYSAVLWLDGRTESTLKHSIAHVVGRIPNGQIPEVSRAYSTSSGGDLDAAISAVTGWLSKPGNSRWLLVIDNVDLEYGGDNDANDADAYDVSRYFPEADQGAILITTRLAKLEQLGAVRKLDKVDETQAHAIFSRWYGKSFEASGSSVLFELLDGLPLAIAQAAAYMRQSGIDFTTYSNLYKNKWKELMAFEGNESILQDYSSRSVWTTWTISYNTVRTKNEGAANLLLLWAHLDNRDVWYGLIAAARDESGRAAALLSACLHAASESEIKFIEAMRLLRSYSMVEETEGSDGYTTHPVVHSWARHIQSEEQQAELTRLAAITIGMAVPSNTLQGYWVMQRRLMNHAQCLSGWLSNGILRSSSPRRSDDEELKEKRVHAALLDAINSLGDLYSDQNKLEAAGTMYERALVEKEKALGLEHKSTLDTVNNLGILYYNQGKPEAQAMYERAQRGYEKTLGLEHTSTLMTVNNLGLLYYRQGKLEAAEAMYERALKGKEKVLGKEHTSTLMTVHNLGIVYSDQGNWEAAEAMYERALKGKEKALGLEHTSTLREFNSLGILYSHQGKMKASEDMYERAMQGFEKALGPEHTLTLDTVNNLAILYHDQGKYDVAEAMYERALRGYEKALGSTLVNGSLPALNIIENYARLYAITGRPKLAREMYSRALPGLQSILGMEHARSKRVLTALERLDGDKSVKLTREDKTVKPSKEVISLRSAANQVKQGSRASRIWGKFTRVARR